MMAVWLIAMSGLLLLAVGALVAVTLRGRRQVTRLPGAFRCRLRLVRGSVPGVTSTWQGRPVWAAWAHDVLLVRTGRVLATVQPLEVRSPEGSVAPLSYAGQAGLGRSPVVLRLRLDGGAVVDVAAPGAERERLAGPFVVACLTPDTRRGRPPAG